MSARIARALATLLALTCAACTKDDAGGDTANPGLASLARPITVASDNGCQIDDDCAAGSFCFRRVCASECRSDEDCPKEARCSKRARCIAADEPASAANADEEASKVTASDLGGIEITWPGGPAIDVPPGEPFASIEVTTSAPLPEGRMLYSVQLGDAAPQLFRAEGTRSFTLTLPTGAAGRDPAGPQPALVSTPMGERTLYLVPARPRAGWYAGTFSPPVFSGAGLPLELGIETTPADALSLSEATGAWLWLPAFPEQLLSLASAGDGERAYVRRPLTWDDQAGVWVALFSEPIDPQRYFGAGVYPYAQRAVRVEISEESGSELIGSIADRWRGLFDQRSADGVRSPGTAMVSGRFRISRAGRLPAASLVRDGGLEPNDPHPQPAPDLSVCADSFFSAAGAGDPEGGCAGIGAASAFESADPTARARCALAVAGQALSGETIGRMLDALLDPAVPDPQGLTFEGFIEACASEESPLCKPTPQLECARNLVASAYLDPETTGEQLEQLSGAYDATTSEAFLGRQLAAYQVDTQTRLGWLRGNEAPAFLAPVLREQTAQMLSEWKGKVLDAHLGGVFGQLDAAGLAVLTRSPAEPEAISNRQGLLLDLSGSWRAALDALVLLAARWNVLYQDSFSRETSARYVRSVATRLYVSAAILQELNRESGSSYLASTFGSGFSELMRELNELSLPFDDLVFARDAEVVTSRSVDPSSNADSLLGEREEAARAAVQDAAASVDLVLDEAQQSAVTEEVLAARYEDQILSVRNELLSLCGLPVGCSASEVGSGEGCDVPTAAGSCGFLVERGGAQLTDAQSASEAGTAILSLREADLGSVEATERLKAALQRADLLGATAQAFAVQLEEWSEQRRAVAYEVEALYGEIAQINDERIATAMANVQAQRALRAEAYAEQDAARKSWDEIRMAGLEDDAERQSTLTALGISSRILKSTGDRIDDLADVLSDGVEETAGPAGKDPTYTLRLTVRFSAWIASTALLAASDAAKSVADGLAATLQQEQALREAQLTALEQLPDLEAMTTENELAQLQQLAELTNLQSERERSMLQAAVDALRRNLELELAYDRDLQELADRRDAWRLALVDLLHLEYATMQADLTVQQREMAYFQIVQSAQLLEGRFDAMRSRYSSLESLLGSADLVFSFANRMARAESRIDRARRALEQWLVALEYYAVRPFVDQRMAILLARNPRELEAIADELLRLQRACGGPVTTETVQLSLRDDLLRMGFDTRSGEATLPAGERFRALLARAQTTANRRVPYTTAQSVGERLDRGEIWGAGFSLSVEGFANLARSCNAKLESIAIELVGEGLPAGQPVVSLVYDGASQLRSCQPDMDLLVDAYGPGATAFAPVTSFRTAGRTISPVAGVNELLPERTWSMTLEGLPVAGEYMVLIDRTLPANLDFPWERLEDVRLQVRYTYQDVFPEGQCQ